MKLVIEIDENTYKGICDGKMFITMDRMSNMISYGTPLEDIKAELHKNAEMHSDGDYYLREEWIDEIINKHIGKENE